MIGVGVPLIAMRLLAYGFVKEAHAEAVAAKARYDAAKAAARAQYPKTAHELGELALVRVASASWVIPRLADAAKARGLPDSHRPAKILGGRSLEHALDRLREAERFRVKMDFPAKSALVDVVGIAIMTRRLDRFGLIRIPPLHYPIEQLIVDLPFGDVIIDIAAELQIYTLGDLLGDAFLIYGLVRTIQTFASVDRYYEMARRYRDEAVRLERFTEQMVEMEHSARALRLDHPAFCANALRWLIISQEAERLGPVVPPSDARWVAAELARATKAYLDQLEVPVACAENSDAGPPAPRGELKPKFSDLAPSAMVDHIRKAARLIRQGIAHQRAAQVERRSAAKRAEFIPILEPKVRRDVGHAHAQRASTRWGA